MLLQDAVNSNLDRELRSTRHGTASFVTVPNLGHGEIEKLKIQDGLPMVAEFTTRKVKFSP